MKLFSRKNQVYREQEKAIKHFRDKKACQRELETVARLNKAGLCVPGVLEATEDTIVYEWIDGESYHSLVDRFEPKHAKALTQWLKAYHEETKMLRGDVNLRNFIYKEDGNKCCGMDFDDECVGGEVETDFGRIIAFAVTYEPPFSQEKKRCAWLLIREFKERGADMGKVKEAYSQEIHAMVRRRAGKSYDLHVALGFLEELI